MTSPSQPSHHHFGANSLRMATIYIVGLLVSIAAWAFLAPQAQAAAVAAGHPATVVWQLASHRSLLLSAFFVLHLLKRALECLFVQKFSETPSAGVVAFIAVYYVIIVASTLYMVPMALYAGGPQWWGVPAAVVLSGVLVLVGEAGNGYHHWLLAQLRSSRNQGTERYKVPSGGLFCLVACPHYFFEMTTWLGIMVASQHVLLVGLVVAMTTFMASRSYATQQMYLSKFEDYPKGRRCMVPFLF